MTPCGALRVRDLVGAAALLHLGYSWFMRPWHLQWGASADEVRRPMPGDELVPHPTVCATRGITIDAPSEDVWPWLVQMGGYTRAGWYSYDRFDNAGRPSADRIIPELQTLRVGDVMLTSPETGFVVRPSNPADRSSSTSTTTARASRAFHWCHRRWTGGRDWSSGSAPTSGPGTGCSASHSTSATSSSCAAR